MKVMEMFMLTAVNTKNRGLYTSGTYLSYGLSGIAVVGLISQGRLSLEDGKLIVKDQSGTGDELMDEVLQVIVDKTVPRKLNTWITLLPYRVKRLMKRVLERLEDNGIVRIDQERFLGLIPYKKYTVTNESERDKIVNACRKALLSGDRAPTPEIMLIISIAAACHVINRFFTTEERKNLKETFKQLKKCTWFESGGDGTNKVVIAIQRAIAATQAAAGA